MSGPRTVTIPARADDLEFSCRIHPDFREIELPVEEPDFSKPEACLPLMAVMATYGVVIFSVAARPAYENGSLMQWCTFLCHAQGLTIEAIGPGMVGSTVCILAETTQVQEATTLRMRVAALEDGGRLILLSVLAPEAVWPSVKDTLLSMLDSFTLARPRGRRVPLTPEEGSP